MDPSPGRGRQGRLCGDTAVTLLSQSSPAPQQKRQKRMSARDGVP